MRWTRRRWKSIVALLVAGGIILRILGSMSSPELEKEEITSAPVEHIDPSLTLIFQDFELFENNISKVVNHLAHTFPDIDILVVSKYVPYPPLNLPKLHNVRRIILENGPHNYLNDSRPDLQIRTNFVMFMPDNTVISEHIVSKFRSFVQSLQTDQLSDKTGYAVPVGHSVLKCHGLSFDVKTWTLEIGQNVEYDHCGYVTGEHGILLRKSQLGLFSNPFVEPTFMSLYIQATLRDMKFSITSGLYLIQNDKPLFQDSQAFYQHKQSYAEKLRRLYLKLGIKLVVRENGKHDWYGCSKETYRCFDTVHNDMPEYLYHSRWTPPCCLKALRHTAAHVFGILDKCKVRYWLEGGTLLGAARAGDIIPWDYDVDIGIYQEDIVKCTQLARIAQEPYIDEDGYSWERATEGDFYRVQYSETNHMHVDIFPFFVRDGMMTKNTWFKTHKQDTEFPEKYLKPLTRIQFAGINASAPNHIKEFLEYKFGKGVIETAKYPNNEIPS